MLDLEAVLLPGIKYGLHVSRKSLNEPAGTELALEARNLLLALQAHSSILPSGLWLKRLDRPYTEKKELWTIYKLGRAYPNYI